MPPTRMHVCPVPRLAVVGTRWACSDCWSEFVFRPVASGELCRIVNLWVRSYEPPNRAYVPPARRFKRRRRRVHDDSGKPQPRLPDPFRNPTNREATS